MAGQDDDVAYANEQAIRLARIRARIREGVWALRDNGALQAYWEALGRGEVAGGGEKCDTGKIENATPFNTINGAL